MTTRDRPTIGYLPAFADDAFTAAIRAVPAARLVVLSDADLVERHAEQLDGLVCGGNHNSYSRAVAQVLRARARRLRWIQVTSAGFDALQENGIPEAVVATGNGGAFNVPVAEHAMALLLALARGIVPALASDGGRWNKDRVLPGLRPMEGASLAVVGLGGIGRAVAARANAFDMKVTGITRSGRPVEGVADVRPMTGLADALGESDAVVVCLPLTDQTRGLIDAALLSRMKRGALLVNVGRGAVVDTDALCAALNAGQIGGAGLDVVHPEPLPDAHPLWAAPNCIVTPHIAPAGSDLAIRRIADVITANVGRFARGEALLHPIRI
ncbi:D-2-hydroxyacid dehydrogenase [Salipiger sp. IMCC34102]|uniref:D-2-hydroxyacid dehydrogenase n=1 Tax=Salipiger sp. IMCC34102 TaxID=2510647 RepID=UPI0013EBDDFE|nr:D-2-hydroxyacid dehydrogenase [Salipiger sp. IMCC34102]